MKFVFIYFNGQATGDISKEKIMDDWMNWFKELGSKIIDGGNPFNDGAKSVSMKEVSNVQKGDNYCVGYSIVEAKDMSEAIEIAESCPMHSHSGGKAVIQIYEAMPM